MDTGAGGIFAWIGKEATKDEKKAAFKNAVVRVVNEQSERHCDSHHLLVILVGFRAD